MLNAAKLLFVGHVRPAIEDPAYSLIHCGDKDAAFTITAESSDDVIATLPGDRAPQPLIDFAGGSISAESFPVRVFFFCAEADDHAWLEHACRAHATHPLLASLELDPEHDRGLCLVRTEDGVRSLVTRPVR
ncbi:MAG: hypothetical protein D6781_02875 [Verrucomicrobia bacterium]|nr:MAG: hypothetical protein D6781_02875 [Verrucomicrobiota bacterium]